MTFEQAQAAAKESFHDLDSLEDANFLALSLTNQSGHDFIAVDRSDTHWPRYGVILAPCVGELVSIRFNGDSYPCGQIKSISKTLKVITTTNGRTFYRRRLTGSWINDGTWVMVAGHVSERNPSF